MMNRRVVKPGCDVEAVLEARPVKARTFSAGTVVNTLQWVHLDTARFTIEGEGIDVWQCPQEVIEELSEEPRTSRVSAPV